MKQPSSPLDNIRIASPCPARWEKMTGDDRVRFCAECSLHVYNLSGMSREEAESLMTSGEKRICIRGYQRADGTIIAGDCPVGLRALPRRAVLSLRAAATVAITFVAGLVGMTSAQTSPEPVMMGKMIAPRIDLPKDTLRQIDTIRVDTPDEVDTLTAPGNYPIMGEMMIADPPDTANAIVAPGKSDAADVVRIDAVNVGPVEVIVTPDEPVVVPEPYIDDERPQLQ
jgi:hypothetical protein